ncbi:hypothetical protein J4526_07445 [Desulfurococcaceae archaeon MEX13E-LK6-19]|nr:hypothetical protein J4526_07445 [Desulfurococcaceae archaeon MEX13E-LK6-19]
MRTLGYITIVITFIAIIGGFTVGSKFSITVDDLDDSSYVISSGKGNVHINLESNDGVVFSNLALVVTIGEPLYVERIVMPTKVFPGSKDKAIIVIRNKGATTLPVSVEAEGIFYSGNVFTNGYLLSSNDDTNNKSTENYIMVYGSVYGIVRPYKSLNLNISVSIDLAAPLGVYELVYHVYRGTSTHGIQLAEIHVATGLGEPVVVKEIIFPWLWPGQYGNITIKILNRANTTYTIELRVYDITTPPYVNENPLLILCNKTIVVNIEPNELQYLQIPIYVKSTAAPGTYVIFVQLVRK